MCRRVRSVIIKRTTNYIRRIHTALLAIFPEWATTFSRWATELPHPDAPPFHLELLGIEQRAQHSRELARTHRLQPGRSRNRLLEQLTDNERVLFEVHALLVQDIEAEQRIMPAGEWLLDNFYVIEEQIRTARRHLPKGYSAELPHLQNTVSQGLPRAYDISLAAIAYGDGRMDPASLRAVVAAYQSVTVLNLGELWAIPIMLRLALIDRLRYVATQIAADRTERNCANDWADQMIAVAEEEPQHLIQTIAEMARSTSALTSSFVSELMRRLRGLGPALTLPLTWIEQRLAEQALTIEQLVRIENQLQASNQVSMSNCISSLRTLDAMNWQEFVETTSHVELTLHEDPAEAYALMDFMTRDRYRHVVEKLAKRSPLSETDIARSAIYLAQHAAQRDAQRDTQSAAGTTPPVKKRVSQERTAHVGYYLIDNGLPELEKHIRAAVPLCTRLQRMCRIHALSLYTGGIALLSAVAAALFVLLAYNSGANFTHNAGALWVALCIVGLLALPGSTHLAMALVNWLATLLVSPVPLPRLDLSRGIPENLRTLVVVPTMLVRRHDIRELITDLEVRFLANRDEHLHFALLTDFVDADHEHGAEDAGLLQEAEDRIEALNRKYPAESGSLFFLFHRPRLWNPQEQVWMGYERKRGKLSALNDFLLTGNATAFSHIVGEATVLSGIRYVITLDTDTQLVRDSARQFVGSMAHPLNRASYDAKLQRVTVGYGILQPRVTSSLSGSNQSRYAQLCSSDIGIDPYTRATSDVYQDVFGEGSFIGKGIYDVAIVEEAMSGRLPDNRVLSHDLLEGCYARSGLLSDIQLYEDYPDRYESDVARRHRWIRGDWQIASWGLPCIPGPGAERRKTPLSGLSRWKILDNVRRSLTPVSLLVLLLFGWAILPSIALWTVAVAGLVLLPPLLFSTLSLFRKSADMSFRQHVTLTVRQIPRQCSQSIFSLLCLPHEALFSMDAICRTLWRMNVSRQGLLEWRTSADTNRNTQTNQAGWAAIAGSARHLWAGPTVAVCVTVWLLATQPFVQFAAVAPLLLLWLTSPGIIWWINRPLPSQGEKLNETQQTFLRQLARKTWNFFETFVGPEDNWLPPDNHQEWPIARTAHRTSPTNIGLSLLANLSACDLGFITPGGFLERTENTFHTLNRLKRYRGHFLNWYDTRSLEPLPPQYVSAVDSGNLAGHLLTLRSGLAEMAAHPLFDSRILTGLGDTLAIALSCIHSTTPPALDTLHKRLFDLQHAPPTTLAEMYLALQHLRATIDECRVELSAAEHTPKQTADSTENGKQCVGWLNRVAAQTQAALGELTALCPWLALSPEARDSKTFPEAFPELPTTLTLRELAALGGRPSSGQSLKHSAKLAESRLSRIRALQQQCGQFAQMDYDFLYDEDRRLLSIGYTVDEHRADAGFYDLLASEARLASFVAIAQGALPQTNWFALGRLLTSSGGEPILLSWSGSMFEYLMPLLVMPCYEHTLLDETCKAAVSRQIAYGKLQDVPWGISECGYNAFDAASNYQYRAFGVPGLGLKRGLAADLVIAPYASALALLVNPVEACRNLERLAAEGFESQHGMYEAIDYTATRLPRGQKHSTVRSFMAHHQGMSLLALEHALLHAPMQRRFAAEPLFQATLLLLQERVPDVTTSYAHTSMHPELKRQPAAQETPLRIFDTPHTSYPEVQLLSNGSYHVMLTNAGGGYSRWRDMAVTRWNEDSTRDNWGSFCYIKDLSDNSFWSTSFQPLCTTPHFFQAIFSEGRAEFNRRDGDYDSHMEIVISSEDDIELRRVRITNRSQHPCTIEVTSFAEIVLALPAADDLHPAFSKLFVQTEILPDQKAILCSRRARSASEHTPWMLHTMVVHGLDVEQTTYETDRQQFIGRGRSTANPCAITGDDTQNEGRLSGRHGSVLDPIAAIRSRITLEGEQSVTIDMVTGIGETREGAIGLVNKYRDRHIADRVFDMTWTHGQVLLRQLNASEADAQLFARLAGSIIYAHSALRATESVLLKNRRGQSGLWGYAISGDLPIVLLEIEQIENIDLVRQLLQAHEYWRLKGLIVDLVIWNEDRIGYRQVLHEQIMSLITSGNTANLLDRPGGVFVRAADRITDEDRILFQTVARVLLSDANGTLAEQVQGPQLKARFKTSPLSLLQPTQPPDKALAATVPQARPDLLLYNGIGGFTPDGYEYVITTATGGHCTPAPWVNVLANPQFGTLVSESGPACTWSENAHEFRLSPWSNDPVNDVRGEAFYLRDEERGTFWSPTPQPCRGTTPYVTRHGFGYSIFEHTEYGIESELCIYVDVDAAIKFSVLTLRNVSDISRNISATGYVEWVLGDLRSKSGMYTITEADQTSGALLARNPYNTEFPDRTAFFAVGDGSNHESTVNCDATGFSCDTTNSTSNSTSFTCDRTEFIGRNGALDAPQAMRQARLSGRAGAGLDPCAALQVRCTLAAGEEQKLIFTLGVGKDPDNARELIQRFMGAEAARASLASVWAHWRHLLGAVHVETPEPAFNLLVNGWLLYQTLACRFWGRGATYQSGGAFGFRDQLQDAMAFIHARPDILREHLLLCAAHQFPEGDVQHWWHPPLDRGVRTRCSDDFLWLPLAVCRYVLATADTGVLDEEISFIEGRALRPEEESYYDLPSRSEQTATLYEHCTRAIEHGLRVGIHGLPLMGSGDWNDGMTLVGEHGQGESVWLAFFLCEVLDTFSTVADKRGDITFAQHCLANSATMRHAIAKHGWDGAWYRRAYFDDGTPLGSASNAECRIDSIAQSWAVLSEAGEPERVGIALDSLEEHLVDRKNRLVRLFTPPFDSSNLNPGYIKGYAPGVRENGGQYTHAAIWAAMAFAKQGDSKRAWELLDMINPINHARTPEEVAVYKVEPYVMAADVYASPLHEGQGGWTWYTGSAAWMYRLMTESLLGLRLEKNTLHFNPCVPAHWESFVLHYRYMETVYHITVYPCSENRTAPYITVDGEKQTHNSIQLIDDQQEHCVEVAIASV